jgi:hypothetical protein
MEMADVIWLRSESSDFDVAKFILIGVALLLFLVFNVIRAALREKKPSTLEPRREEPEDSYQKDFHAKASKEATNTKARSTPVQEDSFSELAKEESLGAKVWSPEAEYDQDLADAQFESHIDRIVAPSDRTKGFCIKVAGVSYPNPDGTSRTSIIEQCAVFEVLNLHHEPNNEFDPNAIAVLTASGDQIGFLDARLAGEVARDCARNGPCWMAVFRHQTHHPDTGSVVGAVIYMIRFSEDYLERNAAEISVKLPGQT